MVEREKEVNIVAHDPQGQVTNDIIHAIYKNYSTINPKDLRDTEIYMSELTATVLKKRYTTESSLTSQSTILGLTIRIDNNLPLGVVKFVTENAQDRAIRRVTERGQSVVIHKMVIPAPTPTLKALLRYWWNKLRRR